MDRQMAEIHRQYRLLKRKVGGKAKELAQLSKVSEGSISRIIAGKARPTLQALYNLARSLPVEDSSKLMAAFLSDLIAKDLRPFVEVQVNIAGNDSQKQWPCPPLSPEAEQMIEDLSDLCVDDEELTRAFADLVHLHRRYRGR